MSLAKTKEQLIKLLADDDHKVLALSGKWGTGKSYLWDEVQKLSCDKQVENCLYVSLFGLSSIDEIKIKLIQSAVPFGDEQSTKIDTARKALEAVMKGLEGFNKGFGALRDIGLIAAPKMLHDRLVVLDDIERKHEKLSIDEVLGFIDEFTKRHGTRFLLILNSDQLRDHAIWNTMREKVIDQELRLTTSPEEAFGIAIGITPSAYAAQIKVAIEACGVTNIRIISKVIKAVNQILGTRVNLADAVLSRTIPSTVLLACIYYKGIENGPDFDFVLSVGKNKKDWIKKQLQQGGEKEETEDDKRSVTWRSLLTKLRIYGCDEFELVVVDFLESGLFDVSKATEIIDRYVSEGDRMDAEAAARNFFDRVTWDHRATVSELLEEGRAVAAKAHLMYANTVTYLHEMLATLEGGEHLAKEAVANWIRAFKLQVPSYQPEFPSFLHSKPHPDIQAVFDEANAAIQANTSGLEACLHVVRNSGWGTRQELALNSMTVQDMEQTIRDTSIQDMQLFTLTMLDWLKNPGAYQQHFGPAINNFVSACKAIVNDPASDRLGKLIHSLFADANLSDLL